MRYTLTITVGKAGGRRRHGDISADSSIIL